MKQELFTRAGAYDYADAYAISLSNQDIRSPEQMFRAALDNATWVQRCVPVVHRHVLRLRLGPQSASGYLFGWRIVKSDADVICLEADGPVLRGVIVGRRALPASVVFTTFVVYVRRAPARALWAVVGPLHRRIAPHLLERAQES
ncbi:hypothetical protein [Mycobacterium sp. IDR2000157661]|uniref:hypothetical protein n=1 Tax=Mycobacterium sp. IDR2000157661 TaxID=2867005 RepID=UPI001EEA8AAB|nr:hypothetical protein [Mycobacterium sp. IDR2000157661]ULE33449.1 hypothetical protein K3G64_01660 [Mycobacterium sp. IDR2000157661]